MKSWFRPPPAPPADNDPTSPDSSDRMRRLEERLEEIERHRWELQHRINVLQEDLARAREQNAAAAREACRTELAVFRRDFEAVFREIYGTVGANFRRLSVPGVEDPVVERFGEAERRRRDEGVPRNPEP